MTIKTATARNACTATKALRPAVDAYLTARAASEVLREKVDAIKTQILSERVYVDECSGGRVLLPRFDWCMTDEDHTDYLGTLAERVAVAIPHDLPEDHCPALVAEGVTRDAAAAVLEILSTLFAADFNRATLDDQSKALDLACGLVYASH